MSLLLLPRFFLSSLYVSTDVFQENTIKANQFVKADYPIKMDTITNAAESEKRRQFEN